jgi:hypothetical protein
MIPAAGDGAEPTARRPAHHPAGGPIVSTVLALHIYVPTATSDAALPVLTGAC